jgi:hypothetical protein
MIERVATTHSVKTTSVASAETAAGPAIVTRTVTAEILLHADPETDQGHQREDPEARVVSNGRGSAEMTTETATFADGRRSDVGIATVAGIAVDGTGHGIATEISGERGRRRKKRSPNLLLLRREVRR